MSDCVKEARVRYWRFPTAGATSLLTSASFFEALEIAGDFRRRGDHMVTKRVARRRPRRISSKASGAYRRGSGETSYLYWDIELEP